MIFNFKQGGNSTKELYEALQYSGLVTEGMTFEEMCEILAQEYPAYESIMQELATMGFSKTAVEASKCNGTITADGTTLVITGSGSGGYNTVTFYSNEAVDFSDFKKLQINCNTYKTPGNITFGITSTKNGSYTKSVTVSGVGTYEIDISDIDMGYIKFNSYLGNGYNYSFNVLNKIN